MHIKSNGILSLRLLFLISFLLAQAPLTARAALPYRKCAVEISGGYKPTNLSFDQVNTEFAQRIHLAQNAGYAFDSKTDFDQAKMLDLSAGIRYWHVIGGVILSDTWEEEGGYQIHQDLGFFGTSTQTVTVLAQSREVLVYLGYMQPLFGNRLEIGGFGAMGNGYVKTRWHRFEPRDQLDALWSMKGDYRPTRFEARARILLTEYASIDLSYGVRSSLADKVSGNYSANGGQPSMGVPYGDYQGNPMQFDFSGSYMGVGITLRQPWGD